MILAPTGTITFGNAYDLLGDDVDLSGLTIKADRDLVWAATGETVYASVAVAVVPTIPTQISLTLYATDADGWLDLNAESVQNWYYILSGTVVINGTTTSIKVSKTFQLTTNQTLDLDLVPDNAVVIPEVTVTNDYAAAQSAAAAAASAEAAAQSAAEATGVIGPQGPVGPQGTVSDSDIAALVPGPSATATALSSAYATVVTPEAFGAKGDGTTDDTASFNAMFAATAGYPVVVRLGYGKTYEWTSSPSALDFSSRHAITIEAHGATVNYNGTGSAITIMQTTSPASLRTLASYGGTWNAPNGDAFFMLQDVNNSYWHRPRGSVPGGALFHLSNVSFWSERNIFEHVDDAGCREAFRFTVDGSTYLSFARTTISGLRLQGGVAGYAKINIIDNGANTPSVYDSTINTVIGNVADGVIVQYLTGSMSGTRMSGYQVEAPAGSSAAAYFKVGSMTGVLPVLTDGPPTTTSHNMLLFNVAPTGKLPFLSNWFPNGINVYGAITKGKLSTTLSASGAATFDVSRADFVTVALQANCTGVTLNNGPTAPAGTPGAWTQQLTIGFVQDATGGHTYAWPTNCKFAGGSAPSDTTANSRTSVTFIYDSGTWYETARAVAVL